MPTGAAPKSHQEAQKFFDAIAEDYRKRSEQAVYNISSLSFRRRQDIVNQLLLQVPQGGTVLDYGMGPAVFGPTAASRGLHYIGVDISEKMVKLARDMNLPDAEFHVGDLDLLGGFKEAADTVLLIGLVDYLDSPMDGLRALSACVRPGGQLVMSFRNHRSIPRVLRNSSKVVWSKVAGSKKRNSTAFEAPVLENSFVPSRDFIPALQSIGFTKFIVHYLDCSPFFFNFPLPKAVWWGARKVDALLSRNILSFMCASGVLVASHKR
jgi:SAM-dependent methyltransferase